MEQEILDRPVEEIDDFEKELGDILVDDVEETEETETTDKVEETNGELDYTPFLQKLSQEIKFMDEEVKIDSVDTLKNTFQKGLNYERLEEKYKALEQSEELEYIRSKAKELGMTTNEFIKAAKEYEQSQAQKEEENELNELIDKGISESMARKILENNKLAREYNEEKLRAKQAKEAEDAKSREKQELDEFLKNFPDVKADAIPKEVFEDAKTSNLTVAYTKFQNAQLKKELDLLKQNQTNKQKAPIKGTTEHGGVSIEKEDDFLVGFNS